VALRFDGEAVLPAVRRRRPPSWSRAGRAAGSARGRPPPPVPVG